MLHINNIGIRDGEMITSSESGKQNKDSILQIFGYYPPSREWVNKLDDTVIRDRLNNYNFFKNLTFSERKLYLEEISIDDNDLYLEDVDNIYCKVIQLKGPFFTKIFSSETISLIILKI